MDRKKETILLIILPLIILGMIFYNAGVMSRVYMEENGLDQDSKIYKARISPDQYDITLNQGERITLDVILVNQGSFIWQHNGDHAVHLSYHIRDESKKMLQYDNERAILSIDMKPDDETRLKLSVAGSLPPGDYWLELDLVEEDVAWFGDRGSPTTIVKMHIR